jgi:rubrerythrin
MGITMSEMAEIMSRKIFLDICIGIEGLCAELYHFYSELYEDNPDATRLWKKTALEEENHRRQFELALLLLNEAEYDVPKESLKKAFVIKDKLQNLIEHVKIDKPELLTAVTKAVEMEEKLADLHVHTSLKFSDESMQRLFRALGESDNDHVAALQRYRTILYLPLCEMSSEYNHD